LRIRFPQSDQVATQGEATSNFGYYFATFVVGVFGFVAGNLALDAIKEQIHPGTSQSSSQPVLTVTPTPGAQSSPQASAAPQSASTDLSSRAANLAPSPVSQPMQPQQVIGQPGSQTRPQNPATLTISPAATDSVAPRSSSSSAEGTLFAGASEIKHDEATAIRLNSERAKWCFDRGIALGQHGSYDKAFSEFNDAIQLNPKLAGAYYCRGVTYWYKGNHDRAAADFNEAIRLDPKLGVAYYGRGCVYLSYGYKAQADTDFAQAKALGYTLPKPSMPNAFQMSLSILREAMQ
jgi:Flp pilus assembly protein TadD